MTGKRRSGGGHLSGVPTGEPGDAAPAHGDTVEDARSAHYGERLLQLAASGVNVAQGARMLEIPETSARRYYRAALDRIAGLTDEDKREIVRLDLETLRMLIQAHMPRAMGRAASEGRAAVPPSIGSAQVVLAAMRERANRLGLDEALKIAVSNTAIGGAVDDVMDMIEHAAPIELPALPALPAPPGEDARGEAG